MGVKGLFLCFLGQPKKILKLCFLLKFISNSGFRICLKELFVQRFDPLTVSYAVLSGK